MRTLLCISREVGVGDIIAASSQDYYSLISQFQYHAVQVKVNAKRHTSVARNQSAVRVLKELSSARTSSITARV